MADSFLSRWSKRKAEVQEKEKQALDKPEIEIKQQTESGDQTLSKASVEIHEPSDASSQAFKGPTMDDVKNLTKESDFSAFVAKDVDPSVQQAAMKTLFSDPHFNVMDGLDIYIDDYSKPDPLPAGMLEKMVQSGMLGLFKSKLEDQLDLPADQIAKVNQTDHSLKENNPTKELESDAQNSIQAPNIEVSKNPEKKSES